MTGAAGRIYIGLVALNASEAPSKLIAVSDNEYAVMSAVRLYINARYGDGEIVVTDLEQSIDFTHSTNFNGSGPLNGIVYRVEPDETWRFDDAMKYARQQYERRD